MYAKKFFLDKELVVPAFQRGDLFVCTCNKEHVTRELLVYVLNSCGLVKVVKKKILSNFTYTGTNKVKENLFVVQTRELVKKRVKENLLVYAGL